MNSVGLVDQDTNPLLCDPKQILLLTQIVLCTCKTSCELSLNLILLDSYFTQ